MATVLERPSAARRSAAPTTANAQPVLAIDGLALGYVRGRHEVRIVDRLDLTVQRGERLMMLGRSGCGKSTLLKAVAGFHVPSAGTIRVDGRPVRGPGPDRAVVFQEFDQLAPWKTVLENVAFPMRVAHKLDKTASRVRARAWLERVRLAQVAASFPHMLSGGMKQRVAIARALALQPAMLLMDEPFAALDALTRGRMQEELLVLCEETRPTLLFVTHSIEEALVVGSRVVVLGSHPGRLLADLRVPVSEPARRELAGTIAALIGRREEADVDDR